MELEFKKVGSRYEAEFEATGNFNLNIERVAPEKIQVFQKGAEDGEYASQASWYNNYASAIVDYDFSALIYPKWIKVVSYSEPVQAIVTMESESGGSGSDGAKIVPLTNQCKVYYDTESVSGWRELSLNSDSTIPNLGVTMLKIESLNVYLTDILTDYFTTNGTITIIDGCLILRDMATLFDGVKLQLIEV